MSHTNHLLTGKESEKPNFSAEGLRTTEGKKSSTPQPKYFRLTNDELAVFMKGPSTSAQRAPSSRPSAAPSARPSAAPKQGLFALFTRKNGQVVPLNNKPALNAWVEEGGKKKAAPKKKAVVKAAPKKKAVKAAGKTK